MAELPFVSERQGVLTEAQLARERVAREAGEARTSIRTQTEEARAGIQTQATTAKASVTEQAEQAKATATTEAMTRAKEIRGQQSAIEREAEEAKATARKAQALETRKLDLPITKPKSLEVAKYVTEVEVTRRQAHAEGRTARKDIERVRVHYFKGIDKWQGEAQADIDKQLTGLQADIATAQLGAEADIAKQEASINSGIETWQSDSLAQIQRIEGDYNKAVADAQAKIDVLAPYKSGDGYDLVKIYQDTSKVVLALGGKTDSDLPQLLIGLGFTEDSIKQAEDMGYAIGQLSPYKLPDGNYNLAAIGEAIAGGKLNRDYVTTVFGETPPQYLTVAQVVQIRLATEGQAYMMGDAWGVSNEQVDKIREAPSAVYAQVYAYLQKTAPDSIVLTHPSQLPSFNTGVSWEQTTTAMGNITPYKLPDNSYDVAKAYQAVVDGKLSKADFSIAFGKDTFRDIKALYASSMEIKPGTWVLKTEWATLTPEQQKEVIATGGYKTIDTTGLVGLKTGEYISQEDWNKLDTTAQDFLKEHGIDKFNTEYTMPQAEPSEGWLKDTWKGITLACTVDERHKENAATFCKAWGIKNQKIENALAQWTQITSVFFPPIKANPKTDPKGYLIEAGKTLASYAPIVWVVNWKDMSPTERIINGAMDALMFATLGLGAGIRAIRARPIMNAAKVAGKAADNMGDALRVLAKTPMDDTIKFAKVSSNAQKAIQTSKIADIKFVTELERVKALTPRQLGYLEKASQIKGLKNAILDVSKAQTGLNEAWKALPKTTLQKMGGKEYIVKMAKVEKAQTALNKALATFNTKLEPRFKVNPTPEFKGFAMDWRKTILPTLEGGDTPLKAPGEPGGYGSGGSMGKGFYEQQYKKMVESWRTPPPYEASRSRVATAVLEEAKTAGETTLQAERSALPKLELKTLYDMKLKPVYRTAEKVTMKGVAPAIKVGSTAAKVAVATSVAARELTKTGKQIYHASAQAQTVAIGKVLNAVIDTTQPVTAKEWNTERAIRQITQDATRVGVDASIKNLPSHKLRDLVYTQIQVQVRNITSPELRLQLQGQTQYITDLVIKLVTTITAKTGEPKRPIKPGKPKIPIKLPEAKGAEGKQPEYPKGTVVFRMGKTKRGPEFKAMLPPYDQTKLVSSKLPPKGMTRTQGTPQQTLTFIGGKVPFGNLSVDLGVTDVFVDVKRKRISFKGHGLLTDVGRRIPGPTRGVSLTNNSEFRVERQGPVFMTRFRGSNAVALSRHNPRRKRGRRL